MTRRMIWIAGVLLMALSLGAVPAFASIASDKIVAGSEYTLKRGERLDGNLTVVGGRVVIEQGSEVTGDVVTLGGNVDAQGQIDGNLTVIGGQVNLHQPATVRGNVVIVGGKVNRDPGVSVGGSQTDVPPPNLSAPVPPTAPVPPLRGIQNPAAELLSRTIAAVIWAAVAAVLAAGLVWLFPRHLSTIGEALVQQPALAGVVGVITGIALAVVVPLLIITICLSPVGLALALAGLLAQFAGWVALGMEAGTWLLRSSQIHDPTHVSAAALGTGLITLVVVPLLSVPCLGILLAGILGAVGLGSVVLTRFGTQIYVRHPVATSQRPSV